MGNQIDESSKMIGGAETTIQEFGKELKMKITCNAIDILDSYDKNYIACVASKSGGFNDPTVYFKLDADHMHVLKQPKGSYVRTISLRDIGW